MDRGLTCRLLKTLREEDPRIPSWSVVDRTARKAGSTGGQWLREATQGTLGAAADGNSSRKDA